MSPRQAASQKPYGGWLLLGLFAVGGVLILSSARTGHKDTYLLMAEYGLLLPAILAGVRAIPTGKDHAWVPVPPILLTVVVFLCLNFMVRSFITQDIAAGDEGAYHFQARLFGEGMVAASAPPEVEVGNRSLRDIFRFHHHVMVGDRWLTQYPPGWPAFLSLAWRMGLDWLTNPLLGVVILVLTWRIGSGLYDERTGALGAALAALSISFVHQTSGFLSHPSCGAFLAGAVYFWVRARQKVFVRNATCSLLCIAVAGIIRPYTGFCAGIVLGLLLLTEAKRRHELVRALLLSAAVGCALVGLLLSYNLFAHGRLSSYSSAGWNAREIFAETPLELVRSLVTYTRWSLQATMMYSFPFVLPLAIYAVAADRERRLTGCILAALFLSLVAGYGLTKLVSGFYFGERYYFEMLFALCLLGARGILLLLDSRPRTVLWMAGPALGVCVAMYGVHAALYVYRASEVFAPFVAVRDASRGISEPNSVVYLPVGVGRDINLNTAHWREAPRVYLEDPGESLRSAVTGVLGRRAWYVIGYDTVSGKTSVARDTLP